MFIPIWNSTRDYAWGAPGAISDLLGYPATTVPEAELWWGTHPGSPTRLSAEESTLSEALLAHPEWGGDEQGRLPILFKVLAAASPLSIQVHPNPEQAREGFERENAAGIALDDPARNYRDPFAKPELIVAVRDGFEALAGFRPLAQTRVLLRELDPHNPVIAEYADSLEGEPESVLRAELTAILGHQRDEVVAAVSAAAIAAEGTLADTLRRLSGYPGDPGILVAAFLHRVSLATGEALYLPAGSPHAYLEGVGLELMVASDNVLRGGITPKHVDVPELLRILDFHEQEPPLLPAEQIGPHLVRFAPPEGAFELLHASGPSEFLVTEPTIALALSGHTQLELGEKRAEVDRGQAVFIPATTGKLAVSGVGDVWFARGL